MNEEDMSNAGIRPRDLVDLENEHGGRRRIAPRFMAVPYPIPRSCVATYFPEANVLIPLERFADRSFTPTSKDVIIKITRSG